MATTFSNERRMATAEGSANGINLRGEFQINAENRINNFNGMVSGQVNDADFNGYFNVNEKEDGNISFNLDNVPSVKRADAENIIFATVADIHAEFDAVEE